MTLTKDQKEQMDEIFPNGWEESNIPAIWRKEEEERKQEKGREIEDL